MGLFSNRVDRESLKPGDHIYSWRVAYIYAHHGIYVGDNKVIHFTRHGQEAGTGSVFDVLTGSSAPPPTLIPCPNCTPTKNTNGVIASCLDCFLSGGVLYRFEYSANLAVFMGKARGGTCTLAASDPLETTLHRANCLLDHGFGCYNVFKNNCVDFALYCKTGLLVSDKKSTSQSGPASSSFIGGSLTGVVSVLFKVTKTTSGVLSGAAMYYVSRYTYDFGVRSDVIKLDVEDLPHK
ncbi:unnamed protein product [Lactuca virosa]|uniref:LRAT domain-containing protein n=1 Tax=Lactuca virosa TaxID=75947 RepID=A0AAU9LWN8_9ASTR|nr:unnamed protein product [Lactuca virosa]